MRGGKLMRDENEVKLYYKICEMARICKKYFYERKYLPSSTWSIDKVVKSICSASKDLKNKYDEISKNNK